MNCPDCNAHNADSASFCTLCMRSFAPEPAPPPPAEPEPVAPSPPVAPNLAPGPTPSGAAAVPAWAALDPGGDAVLDDPAGGEPIDAGDRPPGHGASTSGRFRRTEEGFNWQCDRCASWSPLEVTACTVCARPFRAAMGQEEEQKIDTSVDPMLAVGFSAVLPGAGHILLGRPLAGWSRLGLFLLWFFGAVAFVAQSQGTSTAPLAAVPLFLGAAALAVVSVLDVQFLLAGSKRTALSNRGFFYLVIGVFLATIGAMVPGVLAAADTGSTGGGDPTIVVVDPSQEPGPTDAGATEPVPTASDTPGFGDPSPSITPPGP